MAKKITKLDVVKELIAESQRAIWMKEISRDYYAMFPANETFQKNTIAAGVEIQELEAKKKFFESLL